MSRRVDDLHSPLRTPSDDPSSATELPLARSRQLKSVEGATLLPHYSEALDASALAPRRVSLTDVLNKPLPPLPPVSKSAHIPPSEPSHQLAAADSTTSATVFHKPAATSFSTALRTVRRAISFHRKDKKSASGFGQRPANYVDKGTQTDFPEPSSATPAVAKANHRSLSPKSQASARNHVSIIEGHKPDQRIRSQRPGIANMHSLKSFLANTSPSSPGTPSPFDFEASLGAPSARSLERRLGAQSGPQAANTDNRSNDLTATRPSLVPAYQPSSTGTKPASINTYSSQYSTRSESDLAEYAEHKTAGAISNGAAITSTDRPTMNGAGNLDTLFSKPAPLVLPPPLSEPTRPEATALSVEPGTPPSLGSTSNSKGQLAPLTRRKGSPGKLARSLSRGCSRHLPSRALSPLRKIVSFGEPASESETPAAGVDRAGSKYDSPIVNDKLQGHRSPSTAHHDHHARAARQGLPPDAYVPPPSPPLTENLFRRPVFHSFSTSEAEEARQRMERMPHVPDHYQNSPLCPLHPKHRGGPGSYCPIHGGFTNGNSDMERIDQGNHRHPKHRLSGDASMSAEIRALPSSSKGSNERMTEIFHKKLASGYPHYRRTSTSECSPGTAKTESFFGDSSSDGSLRATASAKKVQRRQIEVHADDLDANGSTATSMALAKDNHLGRLSDVPYHARDGPGYPLHSPTRSSVYRGRTSSTVDGIDGTEGPQTTRAASEGEKPEDRASDRGRSSDSLEGMDSWDFSDANRRSRCRMCSAVGL